MEGLPEKLVDKVEIMERLNSAVWKEDQLGLGKNEPPKKEWVAKNMIKDDVVNIPFALAVKRTLNELIYGLGRGAALGFTVKAGMALLLSILKMKSLPKIRDAVFSPDVLQFTRFVGLYVALLRSSNAFLASWRGTNHKSNAVVAGAFASIAILIDDKTRRKELSSYLFFRSLYVIVVMLVRKKILPYIWWFKTFFFGVINIPVMYGFEFEPDILQQGYYNWCLKVGALNHPMMHHTMRVRRDHLRETGELLPFVPCQTHYHESSCSRYFVDDWISGFGRVSKIYIPVHLLPLLLFKRKQLMNAPVPTLKKAMKDYIASCLFLNFYQSFQKMCVCSIRNTFKADVDLIPIAGGMLTSFAIMFEKNSRATELLLYCGSIGAQASWRWLRKRGIISDIPNADLLLFSVASAVLVSASDEDFKPTYYKALAFLIDG